MLDSFETAAGTTAGTKHRKEPLEHNQDSILVHRSPGLLTIVSSDGVSKSPRSHVASDQQVEWLTQMAHLFALTGEKFDDDVWRGFADEIANRIRLCASWSHLPLNESVARTWTATLAGIVMTPEFTHLVSFGDARFLLNGELIVAEAANVTLNQPAAPAYLVAPTTLPAETLRFQVTTVPTDDVQSAVVATDGLDDLKKAIGKTYPGTDEVIPELPYLWEGDKLFAPNGMDNWLNSLGREWRTPGNPLLGGRLKDDLAIGVVRRKQTSEV